MIAQLAVSNRAKQTLLTSCSNVVHARSSDGLPGVLIQFTDIIEYFKVGVGLLTDMTIDRTTARPSVHDICP
jgi:hypothetical protein